MRHKKSRGALMSSPWEKNNLICVTNKSHKNFRKSGGPTWIRTRDRPVMSRELYQLSYGPLHRKFSFYINKTVSSTSKKHQNSPVVFLRGNLGGFRTPNLQKSCLPSERTGLGNSSNPLSGSSFDFEPCFKRTSP